MDGPLSLGWLSRIIRCSKRQKALQQAASWPRLTAKLLGSAVVPKDLLADEGTAFQSFQIETAFYFTLDDGYYGGHLRSVPVSDSEAHRFIDAIPADKSIEVRYNPANPDQNHVLAEDNSGVLPFALWST